MLGNIYRPPNGLNHILKITGGILHHKSLMLGNTYRPPNGLNHIIQITGGILHHKSLMLVNMYRPPNDLNYKYEQFTKEFSELQS